MRNIYKAVIKLNKTYTYRSYFFSVDDPLGKEFSDLLDLTTSRVFRNYLLIFLSLEVKV